MPNNCIQGRYCLRVIYSSVMLAFLMSNETILPHQTTHYLPVSERDEEELETDVTSVNINGSCKSLVSCLAMDSLQTCTVYCGPSADFASLNNTDSATGSGGDDITLQLPPALGREYHCIVSGTASDGSILFRARAMEITLGEISITFSLNTVTPPAFIHT